MLYAQLKTMIGYSIMMWRGYDFCHKDTHDPSLRNTQENMKGLKSFEENHCSQYADFWTVADFWKYYFPCQSLPKRFTRINIRDFDIQLGNNNSGPVLHDLIVPIFNGAATIVRRLGHMQGIDTELRNIEHIAFRKI